MRDLWIVGNVFVNEVYHTFSEMDATAVRERSDRPFIYDFFNVKCYMANPLSKITEVPARIANCISKALNDRVRLPNYVLIIPDGDIVKNINYYNYGFRELAEKAIKWMAKEITEKLNSRKEDLAKIRKGAVLSHQPKFVWVEMIDRIHVQDKYLAMRHKFNGAMHTVLADYSENYILSISRAMFDASLFSKEGKLNNRGKEKFWEQIDRKMHEFD